MDSLELMHHLQINAMLSVLGTFIAKDAYDLYSTNCSWIFENNFFHLSFSFFLISLLTGPLTIQPIHL